MPLAVRSSTLHGGMFLGVATYTVFEPEHSHTVYRAVDGLLSSYMIITVAMQHV